jgi:hypothetical protein
MIERYVKVRQVNPGGIYIYINNIYIPPGLQ